MPTPYEYHLCAAGGSVLFISIPSGRQKPIKLSQQMEGRGDHVQKPAGISLELKIERKRMRMRGGE